MAATNPFQPWLDLFKVDPKLSDLSAASAEMMAAWGRAWQATLTGRAMPMLDLLNPATWEVGGQTIVDALESALGMPQWSDMPSLDRETIQSFAPAVDLLQVGQRYAAAVTRVSTEICREFQARAAAQGLKPEGSGEALDLWNNTVDEVLMAFHRSEEFGELQRRYLRALMAWKLEQRWLLRRLAEQFQMLTRDEVDELARRVHDLERENRRLRRRCSAPSPNGGTRHERHPARRSGRIEPPH